MIVENGRVAGVRTRVGEDELGEVRCEVLVNCAGQWARQFGALAGVTVPLYSAEHFTSSPTASPACTRCCR